MEPRRYDSLPCGFSMLFLILLISHMLAAASAEIHYHDFVVQQTPVKRLCHTRNAITVNGMLPGPTLQVRNGDTLVINVVNRAKYNVTIHWHGVRQMRTAWADGPEFITQCPIRPGGSYTYRFTIEGQEGTLWWHAHSSWLRATVYGALIIYPREGSSYPFQRPNREFPVILGEWWNANPIDVVREALRTGAAPNVSDAFTINGQPGDLYKCSRQDTSVFPVGSGETVLLRVINAALNDELFFSVAGHPMTVVASDASYMRPFSTFALMLGPGETTDVLITTNQPPSRYYMAARAYHTAANVTFDNTTTTAILQYKVGDSGGAAAPTKPHNPLLPRLPPYNDTGAATAFTTSLRSPSLTEVPNPVDIDLFFTVGLGLFRCPTGRTCGGPNNTILTASMNNVSFSEPTKYAILQSYVLGLPGVFSSSFPPVPPLRFNYTAQNVPRALWQPVKGTEVLKLRYGTTVQLVLQGTSIVATESHPMHIHGYQFYILAVGFGNFDPELDPSTFNLIDPPLKNTVDVPAGGWAAIRFVADNPGAWFMHCHFDVHLTWGMAMVFLVEDGVGEWERLEPPPADLPRC